MQKEKEEKRCTELEGALVSLINHMQNVSESLYRHAFDLEMPLAVINKEVVQSIERVLKCSENEIISSEQAWEYLLNKDPSLDSLMDYIEEKDSECRRDKDAARGKRKYYSMLYQGILGIQRESK